jgi:DNA-binding MarR family transcriptional regulator
MDKELKTLIDLFLKILHLYSVINRKPKDYGTGDLLYLTEIHTITVVAANKEINMTRLAEIMGVTKGAISQTIRKLVNKNLIIKQNSGKNKREYNLSLSERGKIVLDGQDSMQKEIFAFATSLYEGAEPHDREMVYRLFRAISANMEERVKAL